MAPRRWPTAVSRAGWSLIVTSFVSGLDLASAQDEGWVTASRRRRLSEALGRQLAEMHDAGWAQLDAKLSNIMADTDETPAGLLQIDLKRMLRKARPLTQDERRANLRMLFNSVENRSERRDRLRFLRGYLGDTDRRTLHERALELEAEGCAWVSRTAWLRSAERYMRSRRRIRREQINGQSWWVRAEESVDAISARLQPRADHSLERLEISGDEFRWSCYLEYLGFDLPRVLAYRHDGRVIRQRSLGLALVEALSSQSLAARGDVLRQAGRLIARLHDFGLELDRPECLFLGASGVFFERASVLRRRDGAESVIPEQLSVAFGQSAEDLRQLREAYRRARRCP